MTCRAPVSILLSLLAVFLTCGCSRQALTEKPITLDELAITVTSPSREVAFTNKEAGFFYTETNSEYRSSWQGWNVMAKEVLDDYQIIDGIKPLRKPDARKALVEPHQLVRYYRSGAKETFTLLDTVDAFVVQMEQLNDSNILVRPLFRDSNRSEEYLVKFQDGVLLIAHRRHLKRTAEENFPVWIGVTVSSEDPQLRFVERSDTSGSAFSPAALGAHASSKAATVVFVAGDTEEKTVSLARQVSVNYRSFIDQRRSRMEGLLNRSFVRTDNQRFDKAFHWALLSMDALVMNQIRKGIFAGLPWFDNYWGRDSFISLPGATLVTGDYNDAKEILSSFARWQEQNPRSPNYGRIPNLVTPGSIAYNTADGTPRFVIALEQYYKYSGDSSFVCSVYPVVKRSIEGALSYHVDRFGFLKHGDAETWMDAAGPAGPWSPRGDRANDIQALWYQQLLSGAALAQLAHDPNSAQLWREIAKAVKSNFNKYFLDSSGIGVTDHLNPDGSQDHQFRPNQLFTLSLIDNRDLRIKFFKTITDRLVYPYGVASLWQEDDNFHPYHHHEPFYVQDAAYHNGIVWTWLAGAWTDIAVSFGHADLAFKVTENMEDQILNRGAVGTLSELLDAVPRPGEQAPRLSGAFSQAWSLAEFIRVFYQDYLGVKVDAPERRLALSPRFPGAVREARTRIAFGAGWIDVVFNASDSKITATLRSSKTPDTITVSLDGIVKGTERRVSTELPPNRLLNVILSKGSAESTLDGSMHAIDEMDVRSNSMPSTKDEIQLASPVIRPDLRSMRGPSYPLLSNDQIKAVSPLASVLYDVSDPEGDDKGTGSYVYPTTPLLRPGSLDITHFTVSADDKNAYFKLKFRELSNPGWHPEYGFQLTYVAIAIDKDGRPGSGQTAVGMNSNCSIDPRFAYETIVYVGGGVRVADSKGAILAEYIPVVGDEANPLGDTQRKEISFALPFSAVGKPGPSWRYTVLVGCQDDHGGAGLGDFRSVEARAGEWTGGGKKRASDSNVYDSIAPFNQH